MDCLAESHSEGEYQGLEGESHTKKGWWSVTSYAQEMTQKIVL